MYKLELRKLREIDEYNAEMLLEHNTFEGQRKFRPVHCNELCEEITDGHFLTGDIALAILKYDDGRKALVNGQHQLRAVIKTGNSISVVYQEYSCQTPGDLSDLYSRFDNHLARSLGDIITPEAVALGVTWKQAIVRLVVSAAVLDNEKRRMKKIEKIKLLSYYLKQGAFIDFLMKDSISCFHMHRAPVVRAIMNTWDKDKQAARTFWEAVRDGVGLPKNAPALILRNYLMSTGLTKSRTTKTSTATTREMYVKSIHAWNAFRTGTRTNLKYYIDTPVPKII
jgi:hypothetical protein